MVLIISCYRCKTLFCRKKVNNNTIDGAIEHDNDDILSSEYPSKRLFACELYTANIRRKALLNTEERACFQYIFNRM